MQGKHIVFLDQYGSLGGGQQVLLELVRAARSLGHDVTVLLPAGPCSKKLRELDANVGAIPACSFTQGKKTIFDILKLLFWNFAIFATNLRLFWRCDLIYVNGLRLLTVAMLAQRILRRKAACHVHLNHGPRELALIRRFLQHPLTQAMVVPSPFIQRQLLAFHSMFADGRVRLVENGLDVRFANVAFEDRFTGRELKHVAIVGRVSPEKGQDVLPDLARQFPEMTFHVLGDAGFSEQTFAERVKAACPANVVWHGWINDLPAKVTELGIQVVLVPSRHDTSGKDFESFSLVTYEMCALSCLVIVRRSGALEDVAQKLELLSFEKDSEIPPILKNLTVTKICKQVVKSHAYVCSQYGNGQLNQRLHNLITSLCATNAGSVHA